MAPDSQKLSTRKQQSHSAFALLALKWGVSRLFDFNIAGPPLREIARSCGPAHATGCDALLNLISTGQDLEMEMKHELGRLELTSTGFGILTILLRQDPLLVRVSDLGEALQLSAPATSTALARLEVARLIHRGRTPENRRNVTVGLTNKGCELIESALTRFEAKINRLMGSLKPSEVQTLLRACNHLQSARTDPTDSE